MVYLSTNANPLYSTSDLRQIRYTTHPTYDVVLQRLDGLVGTESGPLAKILAPLACPASALGPETV